MLNCTVFLCTWIVGGFWGLFVDLFLLREASGRFVAVSFTSGRFALAALSFCVREFLVLFWGLSVPFSFSSFCVLRQFTVMSFCVREFLVLFWGLFVPFSFPSFCVLGWFTVMSFGVREFLVLLWGLFVPFSFSSFWDSGIVPVHFYQRAQGSYASG